MKHITKHQEPEAFLQWKEEANKSWQPTYNGMPGEVKQIVKESLRSEQGNICCYCERELTDIDSHIEHFMPQSALDVDPLDYSNLLCSCQNRTEKGEPRHCGSLKEDWYDPILLISPLAPDCEEHFAFTGDGLIKPSVHNDAAALETIEGLGLGIPKLNDLRAKVIDPFLDASLSGDEMAAFVSGYLSKDTAGHFSAFWTTIHYLFGDYVRA